RALEHRLVRPVGRRARKGAREADDPRAAERRRADARLIDQCPGRALSRVQERTGGLIMQLGMIGLGRMGANIVRRLMRAGHECVVFDSNQGAVKELAASGAAGAATMEEFVKRLTPPRAA